MRVVRSGLEWMGQRLLRVRFGSELRCRFYRELIALVDAGFSCSEAIDAIWKIKSADGARGHDPIARILGRVRAGLRNGNGLGASLQPWIPRDEHMAITAIETSEMFGRNLEVYCRTLERSGTIRSDMISVLAYPVLLLAMTYGILVYFSLGIAPQMETLLPVAHWIGIARIVFQAGEVLDWLLPVVVLLVIVVPIMMVLLLPRWAGRGRIWADRLPVFVMYRLMSGVLLLQSIACLVANGLTPVEAIARLRPVANAYVGAHLDRIRNHMLNGANLGLAMQRTARGWPDRELVLTLRILSRSQDFHRHLQMIAGQWLTKSHERIHRTLALMRAVIFLIVFGVISAIVIAMYDLQGQITAAW